MTASGDEWGPWIEHHGSGRPVPAEWIVETKDYAGDVEIGPAGDQSTIVDGVLVDSWTWDPSEGFPYGYQIVRYRVRRPRALRELTRLVEAPREEVPA